MGTLTFNYDILRIAYNLLTGLGPAEGGREPEYLAAIDYLRGLFPSGEVVLHKHRAPVTPTLPYLVHTATEGQSGSENVITAGMYHVSTYAQGHETESSLYVDEISSLVQELLGNRVIQVGNIVVQFYRLSGEYMPTNNANVWRYDNSYEVRYTR